MATFIDSDELLDNIQIAINKAEYYTLHETNLVPVVHSHWIEKEDCSVVTDIPWSMCAACGSYSPKLLYCAFCGAKMDEE